MFKLTSYVVRKSPQISGDWRLLRKTDLEDRNVHTETEAVQSKNRQDVVHAKVGLDHNTMSIILSAGEPTLPLPSLQMPLLRFA